MLEGLIGERIVLEESISLVVRIVSLSDPIRRGIKWIGHCCSWIDRGYERNAGNRVELGIRYGKSEISMLAIA